MIKSDITKKIKELAARLSKTVKLGDQESLKQSSDRAKKFEKEQEKDEFLDGLQAKKDQSMKDSQGTNSFTGSSYHGAGNIDREKTNSNMRQTNFEGSGPNN